MLGGCGNCGASRLRVGPWDLRGCGPKAGRSNMSTGWLQGRNRKQETVADALYQAGVTWCYAFGSLACCAIVNSSELVIMLATDTGIAKGLTKS